MTNFKDVIDKVQEKKSRVDDNSIYDNLKIISKNTEALKPLSKNLEKLSKDMHTFVNTFKPSFFKKFEESERTYESKPSRISESINPSKVKDGEKEDKKGGFLKGFGVALLGGVGAYVASEDFKKAINGMIDGIGGAIVGDKKWSDIKNKVSDRIDDIFGSDEKRKSKWDNFFTNFNKEWDGFFGNIGKKWDKNMEDFFTDFGKKFQVTLKDWIHNLQGTLEPLKNRKREQEIQIRSLSNQTGEDRVKFYQSQAESSKGTDKKFYEDMVKTLNESKSLSTSQLDSKIKELMRYRDTQEDSPRLKENATKIIQELQAERKRRESTEAPQTKSATSQVITPDQTSEDIAKKTTEAALKNYLEKQSKEPQKISVNDYNKEFGTTYATTDPVPYPTKINLGGDNVKTAMDFFMSNDFTKEQAAGIVGNLQVESGPGLNPTADNGSHYGIAQWDRTRESDFMKLYGKSIRDSSLMEQLEFLLQELPKNGLSAVKDAKTAEDAAIVFENKFERSGGQLMQKRIAFANKLAKDDYTPTMEPSKNRPQNIPMAPQEEKSDDLLGSFNGLLSKLSGKGIITSEDIGLIKSTASKEIGEISGRMQNILGGDLGSVNKSMREVQGASKVSPAPIIQTTNNQSSTPSGPSSGDIASPIDIDIAKLMMHVI